VKNLTTSAKGTTARPGRNVQQKAALNRRILDNAPHERRRQLAYKAPRFGSQLRLVPAPGTSQTCSACGTRDPKSRQGCGRLFACAACGHQAHADLNAARNIHRLAAGQAGCSTRSHRTVARPSGAACVNHPGALHERPGVPALQGEEDVKSAGTVAATTAACRRPRSGRPT
jgi:putative transposase